MVPGVGRGLRPDRADRIRFGVFRNEHARVRTRLKSMRTSDQIRREFIEFFVGKQHTAVPSAPVVPVVILVIQTLPNMAPGRCWHQEGGRRHALN